MTNEQFETILMKVPFEEGVEYISSGDGCVLVKEPFLFGPTQYKFHKERDDKVVVPVYKRTRTYSVAEIVLCSIMAAYKQAGMTGHDVTDFDGAIRSLETSHLIPSKIVTNICPIECGDIPILYAPIESLKSSGFALIMAEPRFVGAFAINDKGNKMQVFIANINAVRLVRCYQNRYPIGTPQGSYMKEKR